MAKNPGLTLNKWMYGISPTDYTGGSFWFSKGIKVSENSFTLDGSVQEEKINSRSFGDIIAQLTTKEIPNQYNILFTKDGYIEGTGRFNEQSYVNGYTYSYGSVPEGPFWNGSDFYRNAVACGDYMVGIRASAIDIMKFGSGDGLGILGSNIVTTGLTTLTGWTIGSGWTTGVNGATHTSGGGISVIYQNLTTVGTGHLRLNFLVTNWTTGKIDCAYNSISLGQIETNRNNLWNSYDVTATGGAADFRFIPTDDFDGTITYCDIRELDTLEISKETITGSLSHPVYYDSPFLYIGSGSTLDIIDTTTWVAESRNIIEGGFNIVSINRLGDKILIWASDGQHSKQYYWDGVSSEVLETVDWSNKNITNCVVDGNKAYVMVENGLHKSIYLANGYDNTLLATNKKQSFGDFVMYDKKSYDKWGKFNFHSYNTNSMMCFDSMVAISGYNGVYLYGKDTAIENDTWHYIYTGKGQINNSTEIHSLGFRKYNPYIAYRKKYETGGLTYSVLSNYSYDNSVYNGYLITNPILWDNLSSRKKLVDMKIGYKALSSTKGNIKIYAEVDDSFFWNTYVSGVTNVPEIGDKYKIGVISIKGEVIATDITAGTGTITFKTYENTLERINSVYATGNITKITGDGDTTIIYTDMDNFALIKTITEEQQGYGEINIFSKAFIDAHMPIRHKIKLKIELNTTDSLASPEVYDISVLSDIT